jgi:Fe2+ or Zn2+ uptake regulation protein
MKASARKYNVNSDSSAQLFEHTIERVRALRLKVTGQRKEIIGTLASAQSPLSCEEVFRSLRGESRNLVTVYRSLAALETGGLVKRFELGDGVRRYELTSEGQEHHYVHCRSCGSIEALEGFRFEGKILKLLAKKGYRMVQNTLNIQALCSACQK